MNAPTSRPVAVLFDVGGTIAWLDTQVVADCLKDLGIDATASALERGEIVAKRAYEARLVAGEPHDWQAHVRTILHEAGVHTYDLTRALHALLAEHTRLNLWRKVLPGTREALTSLRAQGVRTAVVSNSEGQLPALMQHLGLFDCFELIVDSAHEGVSKPDPELFRRALHRLHLKAETTLYIGDLPSVDVAGARAAGMLACLLDPDNVHAARTDVWRVASLGEFADALQKLPVEQTAT